ncbi:MAG TPA: Mur ligase domain-containing protein [Candidatus Saccharimonadia bacterium]|nr:Mur ligase domain-containing protein [Candidatus Saccharimonadia bacterium]
MHIYFSGIGGAGMTPLAIIARQAGYDVSGSDKQDSQYLEFLKQHGVTDVHVGQSREAIEEVHSRQPIDWFVYSSAVAIENPDTPELVFCREQGIHTSKRDELLNQILSDKNLKMLAVAGTHGKTTTTAMVTYLFKKLSEPVSYLLPSKTNFAEMGEYDSASKFFVYEADEFDRNFLAYEPALSLVTGVSWDHHEIFPSREDYQDAFKEFISQSGHTFIWQEDADYLGLEAGNGVEVLDSGNQQIDSIALKGRYNRLDAWLAISSVARALHKNYEDLIKVMNGFPGLSRRMEQIVPNLYSDYAHTPEKIRGAMSVASEMAAESGQKLVVVYEPLTNRRQHFMLEEYRDCFAGADKLYWIPSYLAREDPDQRVIPPAELISHLTDPSIAEPLERDEHLKELIQKHLAAGDMVVGMAGGGGGSLDDWLREEFQQ